MAEHFVKKIVGVVIVLAIVLAGFGSAVLYLWNLVMPPVFGVHTIDYWQAIGLLGLSWLLFGGPRLLAGQRARWGRGMRARWEHMTPEERERFRSGMRGGVGAPPSVI